MSTYNQGQRQPQRGGGDGSSLKRITSAYNFVPLSEIVVQPDWQNDVSQDMPLEDGLCAELDVELEAHTPILIGAERRSGGDNRPSEVHFFTHPDGTPAIPGSSLRGMLRNVIEVASFSRMQMMDEHVMSVRDLNNRQLYSGHFTQRAQDSDAIESRSYAAWLRHEDGRWHIYPCPYTRVEQHVLKASLGIDIQTWHRAGNDRSAAGKLTYASKILANDFTVYFDIDDVKAQARPHRKTARDGPIYLHYRLASKISREKDKELLPRIAEGRLVLTGQPGKNKHMEFIFGASASTRVTLPEHVARDFLALHQTPPTKEEGAHRAGKEAAETFAFYERTRVYGNLGIPVFFLPVADKRKIESAADIRAVGLSQLFRLQYTHSAKDLQRQQQAPTKDGALDFVETLFGHVHEVQGDRAADMLKSRVAFGDCRVVNGTNTIAKAFTAPTVLAQPKPTYYPNYLRQPNPSNGYKTYMDTGKQAAELSGWKRYPVSQPGSVAGVAPPPEDSKPKVQTSLRPLSAGARFTGRIRLHNVKPAELGAVVWALTWGGDKQLRHALGMGKPFGLGQVSVKLMGSQIRPNRVEESAPDLDQCMTSFKAYMESKVGGWSRCPALTELLAMANPTLPQAIRSVLTPMRLTKDDNDFTLAKKRGITLALAKYSSMKP